MNSLEKFLIIINLLFSFTLSQLFVIPLLVLVVKFILSTEKRD
ncbi:hypothetical protein SACC_21800 [Saccharolobus caldissimus]|uniref:Uncharacterized protein n=1 Tax=Saccharolobus caldissimus TaxID=1702097 RepID=A0AAQ4CTN2_9CREN|nr:hypothetical protein SACC_21800 [Saccharolobus caldissimus]